MSLLRRPPEFSVENAMREAPYQNAVQSSPWVRVCIAVCILARIVLPPNGPAAQSATADKLTGENFFAGAVHASETGEFEEAVSRWEQAAKAFETEKNPGRQIEALVNLGNAQLVLGRAKLASHTIREAISLAEATHDRRGLILAQGALGNSLILNDGTAAEFWLTNSLAGALEMHDLNLAGVIQNNLGNFYSAQPDGYDKTIDAFRKCISLAEESNDPLLTAKATCNLASAAVRSGKVSDAETAIESATQRVLKLSPSHEQAYLFIAIGQTCGEMIRSNASATDLPLLACKSYQSALTTAEAIHDQRAMSYALGWMGELYEQEHRYPEALELTRRAVFEAQAAQSPHALYRWQWQCGRLLKASGEIGPAIRCYRQALETLRPIRSDIYAARAAGDPQWSFRRDLGPLFFEFADLLLQDAGATNESASVVSELVEARDAVEQFKSVELEDYFQDPCVNVLRAKTKSIEAVSSNTAVLYIIPLRERTELLLSVSSGMKRFTVNRGAEEISSEVHQFRRNLENRITYDYLGPATNLYQWLIQPVKSFLTEQHIDTLVFVPDGALRTIPFGALHDGTNYLIEQFAVAVTPGLTLIEPKPINRQRARLLVNGLSQAVQGYSALEFVPLEVRNLRALYPGDELLDHEFREAKLETKLEEQYSMVHIASHSHFDADPQKTSILTYDGQIGLDDLERMIRPSEYRGKPIELLALSACQTAAGDDRAALGLAGVAVKSGARSALATLWFVNDESTTRVVSEFYAQMHDHPALSKAKALRLAQLKLLTDQRYEHPCYWAPFLIIGNWL
jgi:CHAT domain-containing protein